MKKMLLGIGVLIICSGCGDSSTGVKDKPKQEKKEFKKVKFIPTEVGKYWIYKNNDDESLTASVITKDSTIKDSKYYVLEDYNYTESGELELIKRNAIVYVDSGMTLKTLRNKKLSGDTYYRYPNKNGEYKEGEFNSSTNFYKQEIRSSESNVYNWYTLVKSTDSVATTPSGKYHAYVFFTSNETKDYKHKTDYKYSYFFAPNTGIVRKREQVYPFNSETKDLIRMGNLNDEQTTHRINGSVAIHHKLETLLNN